jgi:large subunit ribosomal protein L9
MKVILVQDFEGYGVFGDVIEVKDGFANNYLIPRGIALPATESNLRHIQSIVQQKMRKLEREKEKALSLAQALKGILLEISKPIGEKGKLFGSVTPVDIANALKEKGFDVDRKRIIIKTPIKDVGIHTVHIRLHPQVSVDIKVEVKPA